MLAAASHGGARPNSGPPRGAIYRQVEERHNLVRRVRALEAISDDGRKDAAGTKTPKAISVMRMRMNFHLWQFGILQKRVQVDGAEQSPGYAADVAEMERHLAAADEAASRIVRYETPALATVKNIGPEDDFDQEVSELSDEQLSSIVATLSVIDGGKAGGGDSLAGAGTEDAG